MWTSIVSLSIALTNSRFGWKFGLSAMIPLPWSERSIELPVCHMHEKQSHRISLRSARARTYTTRLHVYISPTHNVHHIEVVLDAWNSADRVSNLPRDVDALCEDQEEESVMSWSRESVSSGVEMLNYTRSRFPKFSSVISAPRFPSLPLKSPWWHSQVDQSQPGL